MKSSVPGKLILSGEHAVVQGAPALVMAVNVYAEAALTPLPEPVARLCMPSAETAEMPLRDLPAHLAAIRERHRDFLEGKSGIRDVIPDPSAFLFAAAALADPAHGFEIRLTSGIPAGAGLGSSAAVALALLRVLLPEASAETLFEKALACEHFQHGRSSGLDVAACLHGGTLFAPPRPFTPIAAPPPAPFQIWNTGTPADSTGACVARVQAAFPAGHPVWNTFRETTLGLRDAMLAGEADAWRAGIRKNHELLCEIGVVPAAVREQIARWEQAGCAAKICGAGGIRGDTAGMLLVTGRPPPPASPAWRRMSLDLSASGTCLLPAPKAPAADRTTHSPPSSCSPLD